MKELIQKLVETPGPSGFEGKVRETIKSEINEHCNEMRVDALGNLIARKGEKTPRGKTIMIAGHMDEIGVMATHIDTNGFIRFTTIGGVRPFTCIGGRVVFVNGVRGIIGTERITEPAKTPGFEMMFIDVGATSQDNCPIKIGDAAAFERPFLDLGNRLVSKAMDDRIVCAVMVETIKRINQTPHALHFVFTTQEEVGLRGATTAAYGIDPDFGIAVDVTAVGDTPKGLKMEVSLGKGPAIKVRDESLVTNPLLIKWVANAAKKIEIPFQYEVLVGGGTDAGAINLTRAGAPSICISVPTRYIHSPSEMVDLNDVNNAVSLLVELATHPIDFQQG